MRSLLADPSLRIVGTSAEPTSTDQHTGCSGTRTRLARNILRYVCIDLQLPVQPCSRHAVVAIQDVVRGAQFVELDWWQAAAAFHPLSDALESILIRAPSGTRPRPKVICQLVGTSHTAADLRDRNCSQLRHPPEGRASGPNVLMKIAQARVRDCLRPAIQRDRETIELWHAGSFVWKIARRDELRAGGWFCPGGRSTRSGATMRVMVQRSRVANHAKLALRVQLPRSCERQATPQCGIPPRYAWRGSGFSLARASRTGVGGRSWAAGHRRWPPRGRRGSGWPRPSA